MLHVNPLAQQLFDRPIEAQLVVSCGQAKSRLAKKFEEKRRDRGACSPWSSNGGMKSWSLDELSQRLSLFSRVGMAPSKPQYSKKNICPSSPFIFRMAFGVSLRNRV